MLKFIAPKSHRSSWDRPLLAAGLATMVALWPASGMGATDSPFRSFLGNWKGTGDILAMDGHKERVTCRATYASGASPTTLTQSLVCASDSYRFNVEGQFVADRGALTGHWAETTRNVSGDLTGRVSNGDFDGTVTGPGFTAQIGVKSNGTRQGVSIRPTAGDISSMDVTLQRQR